MNLYTGRKDNRSMEKIIIINNKKNLHYKLRSYLDTDHIGFQLSG